MDCFIPTGNLGGRENTMSFRRFSSTCGPVMLITGAVILFRVHYLGTVYAPQGWTAWEFWLEALDDFTRVSDPIFWVFVLMAIFILVGSGLVVAGIISVTRSRSTMNRPDDTATA